MLSKSPPTDQRACVPDALVAMRQLPAPFSTSAQKMPGLLLQTQNVRFDGFQLAPLMFAVKSGSSEVSFKADVFDSAGHGLTASKARVAIRNPNSIVVAILMVRLWLLGFVGAELFDAVENVPDTRN